MHKNVTDGRKHFVRLIEKAGEHKLWVNDSGHNEGMYYLFSKWVNWSQGDDFSSVGV